MKNNFVVSDFMTDAIVVVASPSNTLSEVLRYFATHKIQHMPVESNGLLIGMVSVNDVVHTLGMELGKGSINITELDKKYTVSNFMTANPITVKPNTPLDEAVKLLEKGSFQSLPVTEDGKIVGIITNKDFVRILSKDMNPPHDSFTIETPGFGI